MIVEYRIMCIEYGTVHGFVGGPYTDILDALSARDWRQQNSPDPDWRYEIIVEVKDD